MDQQRLPSTLPIVIGSVLLGLVAGAAAGGLVGGAVAQGSFGNLFKKSATSSVSGQSQTIAVKEESATTDVVKKVSPAVVSIIATKDYSKVFQDRQSNPFNDFFGFPFNLPDLQQQQPQGKQDIGGGTGFIVQSDGLIVTNKHVVTVPGADEYTVVLNNEKNYKATVLATDPARDVAIIKIDAKDLPTVPLGESNNLEVGQTVIAIGNALGQFRNTATKGVISGLARTLVAGDATGQSEVIEDAIQTDAAINPGNSGGPLLNLNGQAIGINTAISQSGQNIGFSIPIQIVKDDVASVKSSGKITRPFLGVCFQTIDKAFAQQNNLPKDYGALIIRGPDCALAVVPGSPADKAGIVENDIILEIGGEKITTDHGLSGLITKHKPGDIVDLKIYHKGDEKKVSVTLTERKEPQ